MGLDEARSFGATPRQSVKVVSDVDDAIRVFSNEMWDKRVLRAEGGANSLPVKVVIPLGIFISLVFLLVVLLAVVVRLIAVFSQMHRRWAGSAPGVGE